MNVVDSLLEVTLKEKDDFLKVMETLTRIGIASRKDKVLYQSCHILHKKARYYIVHFKELFKIDGKPTDLSESDIQRRNAIALLLESWGLLQIVNKTIAEENTVSPNTIKVIPFKEKNDWSLTPKYNIGKKR
jgi:hypothetical protein